MKNLYSDILITAKFFTSIVFAQMNWFSLNLNSLQQKFSLTSNYLGTNSVVVKKVDRVTFYSFLFVCFVALRPKSTAMVIAGRSVHLTTLFPGQA